MKFRDLLFEQYNLFPIKNKGKAFDVSDDATNVIIDMLIKEFGKIFYAKSTGLYPNSTRFQFDLKKGKEDKFDDVVNYLKTIKYIKE